MNEHLCDCGKCEVCAACRARDDTANTTRVVAIIDTIVRGLSGGIRMVFVGMPAGQPIILRAAVCNPKYKHFESTGRYPSSAHQKLFHIYRPWCGVSVRECVCVWLCLMHLHYASLDAHITSVMRWEMQWNVMWEPWIMMMMLLLHVHKQ